MTRDPASVAAPGGGRTASGVLHCAAVEKRSSEPDAPHTLHVERFGRPTLECVQPVPFDDAADDGTTRPCDPHGPFDVKVQRATSSFMSRPTRRFSRRYVGCVVT